MATLKRFLLLSTFFIFLTGCEQLVLDANDPFENAGAYQTAKTKVTMDTSTSSTKNMSGALYYPKGTFTSHSLPLVMLLPGFSADYSDYEVYAIHLASHGYIVLGMNYVETSSDSKIAKHDDKAKQVSEAIDYAINSSIKANQIDTTKIASMGHSLGGKISFYAASLDPRIKAIIAMDPSNAGGAPCNLFPDYCANYPVAANPNRGAIGVVKDIHAASLIFRSKPDSFSNPGEEFNAYYFFYGSDGLGTNGSPSPSVYIDMGNAAHGSYLPKIISYVPTVVKRDTVAWLKKVFDGVDTSSYFSGSKMGDDITTGRVVGFDDR